MLDDKNNSKNYHIPEDLQKDLKEIVEMFASSRVYESQVGSLFSSTRMMDYIMEALETHLTRGTSEVKH